ncbi:TspO/MBR family protein [Deinococcus pimensis]|uniref:TspO/MBR family protein n=1 Tax=Deinococcus pimensis TaxID=309888 RepID=UPI000484DC71|nr:TspO/MBR family protein [Deinococcus pimensis]
MRGLVRQVVLGVATAVTLVMNTVAGIGLLFGRDPGSISDELPNAFTPAGFTFSIWSVIFLGLIAFALWQGRADQRGERLDRIGWPFLLANVLNVGWLLAWHSLNFGPSVVIMLALLGSLVWLYVTLDRLHLRGAERFWLGVPTSLYLGWISVATIANVTAWLTSRGVTDGLWGLSPTTWAAVLIGVATALGAFLLVRRRDWVFGAVLAWSFYGVWAARPDVNVLAAVVVVAVMALAAALLGGLRRGREGLPA